MALKTQQTVTVTGASEIDGQQVAYFSAQIPQDEGNSTISRNVTNQTLYDANRNQVRADEAEFQAKVYAIEDSLLAEQKRDKMEKYFNTASMLFGLIGGVITGVLGGWDVLTHAIVVLVIVDYLTGLGKAFVNKEVSSAVGFKGIFKKILIFVVIAVSVEMQKIIGDGIPLREIVIMFYIANEGISFIENVSEFLPLPQKMKDIFIQIREKDVNK